MTDRQSPARVMRLAVVDQVLNDGGGSRFVRALLPAMKRVRPELAVTLLVNARGLARDAIRGELEGAGVQVQVIGTQLRSHRVLGIRGTGRLLTAVRRRTPKALARFVGKNEVNVGWEIAQHLRDAEVGYFPWPYGIDVPATTVPLAATVHDLNFQYFFGAPVWGVEQTARMERSVGGWLAGTRAIVSSDFMAAEVAKFYPDVPPPAVVRIGPFSDVSGVSPDVARATVEAAGILGPYILYPTHAMVHKNLGPLIAAHAILREAGRDLRLIFTGDRTDSAVGRATPLGVERGGGPPDVIGLGYVSNELMDALIVHASVVVTSSLYEAGSGPGLDAWAKGVPVAMSDIPPFREHLEAQGVHAELFDPRDPSDIAAAIARLLDDPERAAQQAEASRVAIAAWGWDRTATGYLEAFDAALTAARA